MRNKRNKNVGEPWPHRPDDDDWEPESGYLGIGSYARLGSGKTKMKNVIGFIRPKVKPPKQVVKKAK